MWKFEKLIFSHHENEHKFEVRRIPGMAILKILQVTPFPPNFNIDSIHIGN